MSTGTLAGGSPGQWPQNDYVCMAVQGPRAGGTVHKAETTQSQFTEPWKSHCHIRLYFSRSDQCIHTQGQGTRPHLSMNCRCVLKLLQSSLCLQMLTCFLHEKYTPSRDRPLWHQAQAAQAIGPGFHHHQIMSLSSVCDRQLNDDLNLGSVSSAECRELICKLK